MNRTFIFNLPKDFWETTSLEEFIIFATSRASSVIFYDGDDASEKQVEVKKIADIRDFISKGILNIISKGILNKSAEIMEDEFFRIMIMEDESFRIAFDIEDSLFI